jgi:hypothetical protein
VDNGDIAEDAHAHVDVSTRLLDRLDVVIVQSPNPSVRLAAIAWLLPRLH